MVLQDMPLYHHESLSRGTMMIKKTAPASPGKAISCMRGIRDCMEKILYHKYLAGDMLSDRF